MREFLEDANAHRDDGYGRAQAHVRQQLPKRFYTQAEVVQDRWRLRRGARRQGAADAGMKRVVVPHDAVAQAMAEEWAAQGEFIDPMTMPMVRLVNSAVEAGDETVPALREEIVKYAGNDLLLYPRRYARKPGAPAGGNLGRRADQAGAAFRRQLPADHRYRAPAAAAGDAGAAGPGARGGAANCR